MIEETESNSIEPKDIDGLAHIGRVRVRSNKSVNLLEVRAIIEPLAAADLAK